MLLTILLFGLHIQMVINRLRSLSPRIYFKETRFSHDRISLSPSVLHILPHIPRQHMRISWKQFLFSFLFQHIYVYVHSCKHLHTCNERNIFSSVTSRVVPLVKELTRYFFHVSKFSPVNVR